MSANVNENALREMDQMPIGRALVKNIVPAIAAMLMMLVYNLADKIFVAMANNDYMVTAVTLVTPVFLLFMAAGNIFGTGGVALMSKLAGEGNQKKIDRVSSFCFWSALVIGVIIGVILFAGMNPLIEMLGASDAETIGYAKDYLIYIAISAPFAVLSPVLSNLIRAEGQPTLSMIGSVVGNIVNIVLDAVFICVFHWGTAGAGAATLIGNVVAVVFYLCLILSHKSKISIRLSDFSGKEKVASGVYAIGVTAAISTVGQSLCQILMNTKMAAYGDISVAGLGAAYNIITIVMVFALGVGQGVQPLLGYQVGNRNKKKFQKLLKYAYTLLIIIAVVLTIICYFGMEPIIGCFVSGAEAINYGVTFGKILLSTAWIYCVFQVCSLVIQVMNKPGAALVVNLSKNAYVFIPVLYISAAVGGMNGIVWSMPIADVISTVIALAVMFYCMKKCFASEDTSVIDIQEQEELALNKQATYGKDKIVITIGREYGAGGRSVGKMVAKKLNIPFYDKILIQKTAEDSGLSKEYLTLNDEKGSRFPVFSENLFLADSILESTESITYRVQRDAICQIAEQGSCVIVGRRANKILKGKQQVFSVFITSSEEESARRVAAREGLSKEKAVEKIRKVNQERGKYYNSFSDGQWGQASGYDLCINAESLGIENAADLIIEAVSKNYINLHETN